MKFRKIISIVSLLLFLNFSFSQTTDLAVIVEAQDLSGNDVSQVEIFEEFQYIVTLINTGDPTSDVTFSQIIDQNVSVISFESQNNSGGASPITGLILTATNEILGGVDTMPTNASVELKVIVRAPPSIGGIATNVNIFPPEGTTDTNTSNNQSIISIDVIDVDIDFSVEYEQISPEPANPIDNWGDTVSFEFTITNNSEIAFPLNGFRGLFNLITPIEDGIPVAQFSELACVGSNGMDCVDLDPAQGFNVTVIENNLVFQLSQIIVFPADASLTFSVSYNFLEPQCVVAPEVISVSSYVQLVLNHDNLSPNESNVVDTVLIPADMCLLTDIAIETTQLSPSPETEVDWNEEVFFQTVVNNFGPNPAPIRFFVQNLSVNIDWEIISLECSNAINGISCDDIELFQESIFWASQDFEIPVDAEITVLFSVRFLEPECSTGNENSIGHLRSGINILSTNILDLNILNNAESDYVILPPSSSCPTVELEITKTQIAPVLPEGSSSSEPTSWGEITYEIEVVNSSDTDTNIELRDYFQSNNTLGTLVSVSCLTTTGTAQCNPINNAQIGIPLDGVPEDGEVDVFWEIIPEDNWLLPAQSSIIFEATINWEPNCSTVPIPVTNRVDVFSIGNVLEPDLSNNEDFTTSFLAPCVDLVVQTFPEVTSVAINESFDWIVDITNSTTSSNATDVLFEDLLDSVFTINGSPSCEVTFGDATCISDFTISDNLISGIIPNMEAGSTVRISIPVIAPNFGGAFTNRAEAIPSEINNEEVTPGTNISISNVQVLAPGVLKSFLPDQIVVGNESVLTLSISNLPSNDAQSNIGFLDVLPDSLTLVGEPYWEESNGATATFIGEAGDGFVGITNLSIPDGVSTCSFSVVVTSSVIGTYLNDSLNFMDLSNIDASQASATLDVIDDNTDVDISVGKTVSPQEASIGDTVFFTINISNLGTTIGTTIVIGDNLPEGYTYQNHTVSAGNYNPLTGEWSISELNPGETETLTLEALVDSTSNLLNVAELISLFETDRDSSNNISTAEVEINGCLQIPEGISPNSDGFNDSLTIPCIEAYPNNKLLIYNRYGVLVYEKVNYNNKWNGTSQNGSLLPVGTYFYVLSFDSAEKPLVGWVYLNY